MTAESKLRIAWFTPLEVARDGQPVFSKSAYASSIILPLLQSRCEVELFSARAGQKLGEMVSRHFLTACTMQQAKPFDIFFYNLENGRHSDFTRLHLALSPGVTWVHDFTLIDDGPEPILNSPWSKMVALCNQEIDGSEKVWPSKKEQFLPIRPQALREVGMSFANLFSAERDLEQYRQINALRLNPEDKGIYLPLPVDSANIVCKSKGEISKVLRIASCAVPNVESHSHSLLAAISARKDVELKWLVDKSEVAKCNELIAEFNLNCVSIIEGRNSEAWSRLLQESDLSIHLLYTFYQQSNPWLALSLGQGVFSAVLDFSESEYLPENAAIRIVPGFSEVAQLSAVFDALIERKMLRNSEAFIYAKERFDAEMVSAELFSILSKLKPKIALLHEKYSKLSKLGRENLLAQNFISEESEHSKATTEVFSELGWL